MLLSGYRKISCVVLLAAVQFVSAPVAFSAEDELQPEQINNAIEQAKKWLIRQQSPNGTWKSAMRTDETVVGATALVVLALANAGVDADEQHDGAIRDAGLEEIEEKKLDNMTVEQIIQMHHLQVTCKTLNPLLVVYYA